MSLSAGTRLGPYEILAPLGAGGMGRVYKARDTRLGRIVAVKVSDEKFSERFEREARAVAALNHPNICQLYDVGPDYLVMEFVEGAPIAPTDDLRTLLDQAMQIADGMAAAHALRIVHRDLKPGNILVTGEGRVKILDFGLAIWDARVSPAEAGDTVTMAITDPGTAVGTVAYMSPEQARGQKVDARTDLWSLGVILYEMTTRSRPFEGPTAPVIFEAILGKAPAPVRERNPKIPVELERVIARLLEKDRETRYQTAADVRADLKRVERDSSSSNSRADPLVRAGRPRPAVRKYAIAAAAAVLIAGAGVYWLLERGQAKPLTDQDVLVLADFTNTTGDAVFDGALRQALAFELEQSPFLKIMDDEEVNQTLQLMGRPAGQPITNDIAHEVCVREGQKATIGGSIASLGKNYQIALQAINCQTGATLAREQAEVEDKEHVLKAVAKAATGMRAKLGESLSSIPKLGQPWAETTNSLEAMKAYQLGFVLNSQGSFREAIPQFQRAVQMDPNFAMAYLMLGTAYGNSGDRAHQVEYHTKAFDLKDRVSERERLTVSAIFYENVTRDLNKAIETFQVLERTFPRFGASHNGLGVIYETRGEYDKAQEEDQEAVRENPRSFVLQGNLIRVDIAIDRFDDAKVAVAKMLAQTPSVPAAHVTLLRIAYIQDDRATQEKEIQWFAGKPDEYRSFPIQAINALVHGRRRKAREIYQRAAEMARRQGLTNFQIGLSPALMDAFVGDCEAARQIKDASQLPARVLCGDAAAVRLVEENAAKNPTPNPEVAALLYRRGLADLNAHKGAEAAAEFQKVLDHKGRNWGPYYSPSYLGLARASAITGDTAKAKRAYQDFLALWKDADNDLPLLSQATKELAELR